jgi:hypothetical protein
MTDREAAEEALVWHYADGRCICDLCGKLYYDHPLGGPFGWQDRQWLHRLCDGRLVKL